MEKRKQIKSVLRSMEVGQKEEYLLTQRSSVCNTVYTSMLTERAEGKKWSIYTDVKANRIIVTRVQ